MGRSFGNEFRFVTFLLTASGILPRESWSKFVNFATPFCSVFALLFLLLPAIYGLASLPEKISLHHWITIVGLQEEILFLLLKMIILIFKRQRISELLRLSNILWQSVENESDFAVMEPFLKQGRYLACGLSINSFIGCITMIITPFFHEIFHETNEPLITIKSLPFPNGINVEDQAIYGIWYAMQVLTGMIATLCTAAVDSGIAHLIAYTTAHMKLVRFWLNDISECQAVKNNAATVCGMSEDEVKRRKFLKCIKHHQNVMTYCDDLENISSYVMLLQTVLTMTVTALVGGTLLRERDQILLHGLHMMFTILRLLICCWPSNQITTEGLAIAEAVYSIPWTSWPQKDRKLVSIMMTRAQKPATLTAGKFMNMSLSTFSMIMSKAMSFYAVLRTTT